MFLTLVVVSAALHGDRLFDTSSSVDETERARIFRERHGSFPDPAWLQRETPSYSAAMNERERAIMRLPQAQERWDAWMFFAQARLLTNFTATQWHVMDAPTEIWDRLYDKFHASLPAATPEMSTPDLSGVFGPHPPDFLEQEALNYEILHALKPLHEAWCGIELEPTSAYGVRVYRSGATLKDHLDVPETHVISSIFHIDSNLDAPFPLEIQDASGAYAALDLKPGQLAFYESAKAFHKRSIPMQGRYYASLFLHYRPKDWDFGRHLIRFAIPPYWADNIVHDEL